MTLKNKKIWIDLDNSPHVLFFNPIISELRAKGFDVVVTARDYAQVFDLVELFEIDCIKVGKHYGSNKLFKVFGLIVRTLQLLPFLLTKRPSLALSHGSRAQMLISKLTGLPTVFASDYEHAQSLPFPVDLMLVPEMISNKNPEKVAKRIQKYPGIKEDVYVQGFKPNPSLFKQLGVDEEKVLVTIRPPATVAHYHTEKSDKLFEAVVDYLGDNDSIQIIIAPRTKDQEKSIRDRWPNLIIKKKIIIPDNVMNGLDLVWYSDLVVSAGGTMIREAAALDVPAYSIFGGKLGAVDKYLSDLGRLKLISSVEEVKKIILLSKRKRENICIKRNSNALKTIVASIEDLLLQLN